MRLKSIKQNNLTDTECLGFDRVARCKFLSDCIIMSIGLVDKLDLGIQNLLKIKILLTLVYAIAYKNLIANGEMLVWL
jgi:hypothetical protein